jgi:hypothetical protein
VNAGLLTSRITLSATAVLEVWTGLYEASTVPETGDLERITTQLFVAVGLTMLVEMPETTTTTVNQGENGQYQTTIPKALGDALDLDGKKVTWKIETGTALRMQVEE